MRPVKILVMLAVGLTSLFSGSPDARAEGEPAFLRLGAGVYNMFYKDTSAAIRVEYVFAEDRKLLWFTPFVGVTATVDGAVYGYAGLGINVFFGKRYVLTPDFAAGYYRQGGGKDLGSSFEIRSGFDFAYRFDDRSRFGVAFHHVSNAGSGDINPGEETLMLSYSIPLQSRSRD